MSFVVGEHPARRNRPAGEFRDHGQAHLPGGILEGISEQREQAGRLALCGEAEVVRAFFPLLITVYSDRSDFICE